MTTALLRVTRAGPSVTVQDGGRPGLMRFGVPVSGPMDTFAHAAANVSLGRPPSAAAIEISLGGLALTCAWAPVTIAICGGEFAVQHAGERVEPWVVRTLVPGDTLTVSAGSWGSWCSLAFAGELRTTRWLGSASTHVRSGLGGGTIRPGDELVIDDAEVDLAREGAIELPLHTRPEQTLRVVLGPQLERFAPDAADILLGHPYRLTAAYDRMGVRLEGPPLGLHDALGIPSTPIVRGSLQVAGDGVATLLFADHQTTGGYPKIATVIAADAARATQLRSGDAVDFVAIDPDEAVRVARAAAAERARRLVAMAERPGLVARRLLEANLISGFVDETPHTTPQR
jgi:biotin-dependent carboxylase-like uncharacterized protein